MVARLKPLLERWKERRGTWTLVCIRPCQGTTGRMVRADLAGLHLTYWCCMLWCGAGMFQGKGEARMAGACWRGLGVNKQAVVYYSTNTCWASWGHSSEQNSKKPHHPFAYIQVEETHKSKDKNKFQGIRTWNSDHGIREVELWTLKMLVCGQERDRVVAREGKGLRGQFFLLRDLPPTPAHADHWPVFSSHSFAFCRMPCES